MNFVSARHNLEFHASFYSKLELLKIKYTFFRKGGGESVARVQLLRQIMT